MQGLKLLVAGFCALTIASVTDGFAMKRTQIYAPRNDNFAAATPLKSSERLQLGHIFYASREAGEPRLTKNSRGSTAWYSFKSENGGRAIVVLTTGRLRAAPLQFAVYSGRSLTKLKRLGFAQVPGIDDKTSAAVAFDTQKGVTYRVQVDSAPQNNFYGEYQIGLQEFPATGGLGIFLDRPSIIDQDSSAKRYVLVGNAFKTRVDIQDGLTNIAPYLSVTNTGASINPGKTSWYTVEAGNTSLPTPGTRSGQLLFTARDTSGGILGGPGTPFFVLRRDYANKPVVLARFSLNGQGARVSEAISSAAYVKNTSKVKAIGCRFVAGSDAYGLSYTEKTKPNARPVNEPFDLAAGEERIFDVTMSGSDNDYYDQVNLDCANYNGTISDDNLSWMWGYQQLGLASALKISPLGANVYKQIQIPDFGFKSVVVKLENSGEYSGVFRIGYDEDSYLKRADVTSFCISDVSGNCVVAPADSYAYINLAPAETGYVTFRVDRGNDATSGFVYVLAESIESPGTRRAGYGGFEVIKK